MGTIRAIVRGTTTDFSAFVIVAERACALVEENEPGTLRYECFTDEETAQFVWHEVYEDAQALFQHNQNLSDAGIMEEVGPIVEWDGMTVLGDVSDPELHNALGQFGAQILKRQVGVVR
jgi:quinol monooxygenase YgiN